MRSELRMLSGRDYLEAVVGLLQIVRSSHPTAGVWEAADLEWWWRKCRSTDESGQPFWFTDDRPVAASITTDWRGRLGLDTITLPDASADFIGEVFMLGIERIAPARTQHVEVMVDDADSVMISLLTHAGFVQSAGAGTSAWMDVDQRPPVAPLAHAYRLASRRELADRPHHFVERNGPEVEHRLRETTMYRSDLDLAVLDETGRVCAYGLFWHDPITGVVSSSRWAQMSGIGDEVWLATSSPLGSTVSPRLERGV